MLAIWLAGEAVGVDLSPRPYYVMGPLLFLVMLVPFTMNGLAVRESFFVSFLGKLGVDADEAFATGFLFFVVTIALSLPGRGALGWQSLRGFTRATPTMASSAKSAAHFPRGGFVPSLRSGDLTIAESHVSVVVVTFNGLPWIERASRACAGTRRSSSTTARPTGRSSSCASAFPRRA